MLFHQSGRNRVKRICFFPLITFSVWTSIQAQIVITSDEIPSTPGTVNEYYIHVGGTDTVDVGGLGGPQTWDFSQGSTADSIAERIVHRNETPFGEQFPDANVVYETDGLNIAGLDTASGFMYMKLDEDAMALQGAASENIFGVPLSIVLDSSLTTFPLPLEYGISWSDSTFYLNIFEEVLENPDPGNPLFPDPYIDAKVEIGFIRRGEVDGWGTVIVPEGQYDVLRVRRVETTRLNVSIFFIYNFVPFFDSTQTVITYDWYAQNVGSVATVTSRPGETDPNFTRASRVRRLYRTNAISNRPPVIVSDSRATAYEDRLFVYVARASDPEDDPVSFSFIDYATWLSPSDSTISGTPLEGTGDTRFIIIASDNLLSDSLVVNVSVRAVNDPPIILPLPDTSFVSGDSLVLDLSNHVEDVDSPDSVLTWSVIPSTESVIVTIEENRAIVTAPAFAGTTHLFFTVVDDSMAGDTDTVLVTVMAANAAPEILSDSAATAVEDELFSYVAQATDPNGDPVTISFVDYPRWMIPSDSLISGTPVEGIGDTSFIVIATDGLLSDSCVVNVTVKAVNDPPVIISLPDTSFICGDSVLIDLSDHVEDVDSPDSVLSWSALALTEAVFIEIEEARARITAPEYEGTAEIVFTVVDDSAASDTDTLLVTVFSPTGLSSFEGTFPPEETDLLYNYPNPFNPITHIHYTIPSREQRAESTGKGVGSSPFALRTTLTIYNLLGRVVRILVDEVQGAGEYVVTWDGRDSEGNAVTSGVYFYVLKVDRYIQTKKSVLLK